MIKNLTLLLAAALLFSCGAREGFSREGAPRTCTDPTDIEMKYAGFAGYDPDGCTQTERMFDVAIPDSADESADIDHTEFGESDQAITVANGSVAATQIDVNGQNQITGFRGACPVNFNWTTAQPLIGNCLIPEVVDTVNWAVCPGCYTGLDLAYMRNRMKEAWDVWRANTTTQCGLDTFLSHLPTTAKSELTSFSTPNENYDNARILIYPVSGTNFSARMGVDKDFIFARTPVRNGIRYWSWQNAALEVNHQIIESVKLPACVQLGDPDTTLKLMRAYRWILAHELGHAWGISHKTSGIMRPSSMVSCGELFSAATNAPALTAPDDLERGVANTMRNSTGFSVIGGNCTLAGGSPVAGVPDDVSVVAF